MVSRIVTSANFFICICFALLHFVFLFTFSFILLPVLLPSIFFILLFSFYLSVPFFSFHSPSGVVPIAV